MSDKIHVVFASDANYLPGLEVAKGTMIAACSDPARLEFHIFDEEALAGCAVQDMPKWNGSHMPYLRLWLPRLLPDVDYVVYSDVDTIWNRDVVELWTKTVEARKGNEGPAICWVRDMLSTQADACEWIERVAAGEGLDFVWARYCCSGICVMNLKKMREMNFTQRVLDLYAKYGVPKFPDQDVLNVIFNRDSELLPSVWGTMGDWRQLPKQGEKCVYHLTGVGIHFNDKKPPNYPPQYQFWWKVRVAMKNADPGRADSQVGGRVRLLAVTWPLHALARVLPLKLRERVVRQWFFSKVLVRYAKETRRRQPCGGG